MGEFGLNDLCERLKEEIPLLKEEMSVTALCWRCKKGIQFFFLQNNLNNSLYKNICVK